MRTFEEIKAALAHKVTSLEKEFKWWQEQSATGAPLEKHQSQIYRLTAQLESLNKSLLSDIGHLPQDTGSLFSKGRDLERKILEAHQVWDYFRDKLMLRWVHHFTPFLIAADEFAWRCYKPLSESRVSDEHFDAREKKTPPLIFFGSDVSPFVVPRDWSFQSEVKGLESKVFVAITQKLPVTVVGLPWYQTTHLPDLLVLAHEMGHVAEMDLKLSSTLDAALAASRIPSARLETWKKCRVEAFADVFGAVVAGTAFYDSLVDLMVTDPDNVIKETVNIDRKYAYPTVYLRVLLVLDALSRTHKTTENKTTEEIDRLRKAWLEEYGERHGMQGYEHDVPEVVKCLIDQALPELGGCSVRQLVGLNQCDEEQIAAEVKNMLQLKVAPQSDDARFLLAAAHHTYRQDKDLYAANNVEKLVLDQAAAVVETGARSWKNVPQETKDADQAAGKAIADLL